MKSGSDILLIRGLPDRGRKHFEMHTRVLVAGAVMACLLAHGSAFQGRAVCNIYPFVSCSCTRVVYNFPMLGYHAKS